MTAPQEFQEWCAAHGEAMPLTEFVRQAALVADDKDKFYPFVWSFARMEGLSFPKASERLRKLIAARKEG